MRVEVRVRARVRVEVRVRARVRVEVSVRVRVGRGGVMVGVRAKLRCFLTPLTPLPHSPHSLHLLLHSLPLLYLLHSLGYSTDSTHTSVSFSSVSYSRNSTISKLTAWPSYTARSMITW